MAGGTNLSHISLLRPQASGAAPTLIVMMVTTDMKRASITMKSAMIANRKAQPQSWTTPVVRVLERLKAYAPQKMQVTVMIRSPPKNFRLLFLISRFALILLGICSKILAGLGCIKK